MVHAFSSQRSSGCCGALGEACCTQSRRERGGKTRSAIPSLIFAKRLIPFPHNQRPSGSQRAANPGGGLARSCGGVTAADTHAANLPGGEHVQARQARAQRGGGGLFPKPFCLGSRRGFKREMLFSMPEVKGGRFISGLSLAERSPTGKKSGERQQDCAACFDRA